jgi:hypothetical protein
MILLQAKISFNGGVKKGQFNLGSTDGIYLVWEVERKAPKVFADLPTCFFIFNVTYQPSIQWPRAIFSITTRTFIML